MRITLTPRQLLARDFIYEFMPHADEIETSPKNEILYLTDTINLFLSKYFGFTLEPLDLIKVFGESGYEITRCDGTSASCEELFLAAWQWDNYPLEEDKSNGAFIHIGIEVETSKKVKKFMTAIFHGVRSGPFKEFQFFKREVDLLVSYKK
mgnify:CR=1 FL=1